MADPRKAWPVPIITSWRHVEPLLFITSLMHLWYVRLNIGDLSAYLQAISFNRCTSMCMFCVHGPRDSQGDWASAGSSFCELGQNWGSTDIYIYIYIQETVEGRAVCAA